MGENLLADYDALGQVFQAISGIHNNSRIAVEYQE